MRLKCPQCQSKRIEAKNYAKRSGTAIGGIAGAISGSLGMLASSRVIPMNLSFGSIASAIIAGLISAAAGAKAGAALGEVVDQNILNNCRCHSCGHSFSDSQESNSNFYTYQEDLHPTLMQ